MSERGILRFKPDLRPERREHKMARTRRSSPTIPPAYVIPSAHVSCHHQSGWICEQAHWQLKEELGLDHFEGRSWQGLHRHALMTMIAYAFLQHRRLAQAGRKIKNQRSTASAEPAGRTPRHRRSHRSTTTSARPVLQKTNRRKATA